MTTIRARDEWRQRSAILSCLAAKTIAVVGLSPNPARPSHQVANYLQHVGYRIIPVNPGYDRLLGVTCYPDLRVVNEGIDLVDVFRDASAVPQIVQDSLAIKAAGLWLQLGVMHEPALNHARQAGLICIADLCTKIEHQRYLT